MKKLIAISLIVITFIACNKEGCTDPNGFNYNADAITDDGSCDFEGCTDANAVNYDANATMSSNCIYDHIGSWLTTSETVSLSYTLSDLATGNIVEDTTLIEISHPDSLNISRFDFFENGLLLGYQPPAYIDSLSWKTINEEIYIYFDNNSDSLALVISEPIGSTYMSFSTTENQVDTTSNGSQVETENITYTWEFTRN